MAALCFAAAVSLAPGYGAVVLDDIHDIVENPALMDGILPAITDTTNPLRAVTYVTYWINLLSTSAQPVILHVTNITLHIAVGLLLYLFINVWVERPWSRWAGIAAAGMVMLNPFMASTALYLSARSALLAAAFTLITLIASIRYMKEERTSYLVLAFMACVAAMLSKETGIAAPLLVLAIGLKEVDRKKWFTLSLPMLGSVVIYLVARFSIGVDLGDRAAGTSGPGQYLLTQFTVIPMYIMKFLWPINLSLQWEVAPKNSIADPAVLSGAAFLVFLFIGAIWVFLKNRTALFFLIWMLLALAPESSFIPLADYAFDHRFYFPGIALASIIGITVCELWERSVNYRRQLIAAGCVMGVCFFAMSFKRSTIWGDSTEVWREATRVAPSMFRSRHSLGYRLMEAGDLRAGFVHLNKAVLIGDPLPRRRAMALNARGVAYLRMNNVEKATADLTAAIKLDSTFGDAAHHLGVAYLVQGRYEESIEMLEYAKILLPGDPKVALALVKARRASALRGKNPSGTFPR